MCPAQFSFGGDRPPGHHDPRHPECRGVRPPHGPVRRHPFHDGSWSTAKGPCGRPSPTGSSATGATATYASSTVGMRPGPTRAVAWRPACQCSLSPTTRSPLPPPRRRASSATRCCAEFGTATPCSSTPGPRRSTPAPRLPASARRWPSPIDRAVCPAPSTCRGTTWSPRRRHASPSDELRRRVESVGAREDVRDRRLLRHRRRLGTAVGDPRRPAGLPGRYGTTTGFVARVGARPSGCPWSRRRPVAAPSPTAERRARGTPACAAARAGTAGTTSTCRGRRCPAA